MRQKSKRKGFTLVELIVVIVIILILAALLIPVLLRYIEKSKEASCRSGMSSLLTEYSAGAAEGVIDPDKDQDIGDLQKAGLISEFSCPSDGEIYIQQDKDGNISIRCTYHDDGKKNSGSSGKFPGSDTMKSLRDFIDNEWNGSKDNKSILDGYFAKYGKDSLVAAKIEDVISDSQSKTLVDKIYKQLSESGSNVSREQIAAAFDTYKSKDYYAIPYVNKKTNEIILYYSTNKPGETQHSSTNLVYYNDSWYFYPNWHSSQQKFDPKYLLPSLGDIENIQDTLNNNGYIKIE